MLNSAAAGQRLARRALVSQTAATLATALACLLAGRTAALGALAGGATLTLAASLAAAIALGGGVSGAGAALGRLLLGMAVKWLLVAIGLGLALAVWRLPPLAVMAGLLAAVLAALLPARNLGA